MLHHRSNFKYTSFTYFSIHLTLFFLNYLNYLNYNHYFQNQIPILDNPNSMILIPKFVFLF